MIVIKREMYMKRIRPFIGTELIKVMTGIRRCGKSVMLELIKEELVEWDSEAQKEIVNILADIIESDELIGFDRNDILSLTDQMMISG